MFAGRATSLGIAGAFALAWATGVGADSACARDVVAFNQDYPLGAIVISTSERKLYYSLGNQQALAYSIAVGKPEFQWYGRTFVQSKREHPDWRPTPRMRRLGYPSYVAPGPRNPLGARAIYLGWSEYRIHGTNAPGSIGRAASSGCFRMLNSEVADLYGRVHIGAPVYVVQ